MGGARLRGTGGRTTLALIAAMLASATLFAGGQAVAAARLGDAGAPRAAGQAAGGIISTVAGGLGGPESGTKVALSACDVAFAHGHLLIADPTRYVGAVREMSPGSSLLTTPAGTHAFGLLGDGGPAIKASLDSCGVTADSSGNLVIGDYHNNRVRIVAESTGTFYGKAMTAGHIYTVAGNGSQGFSGDGGPATSAEVDRPLRVAVDSAGNLLIIGGCRVRVVAENTGTLYGQPMTAGDIYTVAGDGTCAFSGDFGPATSTGMDPSTVAVDSAGNLVIADSGDVSGNVDCRVRVVAESTGKLYGQPMTAGDIYTVAGGGACGFSGDGGPATHAELGGPGSVAVDPAGNLVMSDSCRIRVVAKRTGTFYGQAMTAEDIYTVAGGGACGFSGDGGPAASAGMSPGVVALDPAGDLLLADVNRVRMVPARAGTYYGITMTAGDIYTIAGTGHLFGYSGDGGPATGAELFRAMGVAVSPAGNLVIGDSGNNRFRVAAATSGTFYGIKMTHGNIYNVAGSGRFGFSGDGTLAIRAKLLGAEQVTVDSAGNLLIIDNSRIRVIAGRAGTFYGTAMKAGAIYTVAGNGQTAFSGDFGPATSAGMNPGGVALDPAGNLVIADRGNNRIRVVAESRGTFYGIKMTARDIYTVAGGNGPGGFSGDGGPATHAQLLGPAAVAVDPAGNLVIADSGNARIRVVAKRTGTFYGQAMTAEDIYTVAGNGTFGFSGDGGPATSAELGPAGTVVDASGNLVIADSVNSRVRVVAETTGTFYGQAMTAGDIYTVAGNGHAGFTGDGGPATRAELYHPVAVAMNAAGNFLIADGNKIGRIRMVTR